MLVDFTDRPKRDRRQELRGERIESVSSCDMGSMVAVAVIFPCFFALVLKQTCEYGGCTYILRM